MIDRCITAPEAAYVLGVSVRTIRTKHWRARHGLHAQKFGTALRFRLSELDRFILNHGETAFADTTVNERSSKEEGA